MNQPGLPADPARSSLIHDSAATRSVLARGGPRAWRGIDLVTLAVLGVALGIAFWGFDSFVYPQFMVLTTALPPLQELALGVWILPAVAGMLLVRRPGAALMTELVAAALEATLGNKWGISVLYSGLLQAVGVELVAALRRWQRFSVGYAVLGGTAAAVLEVVVYEWWAYVPAYSWEWKIIYLLAGMISGALIAGVGGHYLVKALAATGAVNAFPPGEEHLYASGDPIHDAFRAGR